MLQPIDQNHYSDQGSDESSVWNFSSALVSQMLFRGKTSRDGFEKSRLFSPPVLLVVPPHNYIYKHGLKRLARFANFLLRFY